MSHRFPNQPVDRRTALISMVSAGAGLLVLGSPAATMAADRDDTLATILPGFTTQSRQVLRMVLESPAFSGQISAAAVKDLLASERKSIAALMLGLLPLARTFSRPPISNYRVGAVAQGEGGSLYLGFNIEFPGQALGFAVHGEQSALSSAYMHGETGVSAIALTAAPCGHCRQFMTELSPDGQIEIFVDQAAPTRLSALLPLPFGPRDLGHKEGAFPIRPTNLVGARRTPSSALEGLVQASVEAASTSYAPYSGACSGAAIATRSGRIHKGSYIENAAFNPSLSPLQTALVQMILAGEEYSEIIRVALAEVEGARISQKAATEAVLSVVAPGVGLEVITSKVKL